MGKRLRFGTNWREIVGVVGTVKNERLDVEGQSQSTIPDAPALVSDLRSPASAH